MSAILSAIARLLLPLFREWWKKKNWSAHSIKNLKEIHYVFLGGLLQFALFLYVVDHGLGIYITYSDKIHQAAIESGKIETILAENVRLTTQNTRQEEQIGAANRLIQQLIDNNPSLAPKKVVTANPDTSTMDKLNGLKKKYEVQ